MPEADLSDLLRSWELALRAERKSPSTIRSYVDGVGRFMDWCRANGVPVALTRQNLTGFIAGILDGGAEATTAKSRHLAVRRFSNWLTEEGEQDADPLLGMKSPKIDVKVVEPLTDPQLKRLLKVCEGRDLRSRRDYAIVQFMFETGTRAGEVVALATADVDLLGGTATIRRGKGGKGRVVPFGPQTARAIDRYMRVRRNAKNATSTMLWIGDRSRTFGYTGLHKALMGRAAEAGIEGFTPHKLRHTAAHRWLAAGGSELGLMSVAGWARPDMLLRYTKAQASARAAEEAKRLNLGEL